MRKTEIQERLRDYLLNTFNRDIDEPIITNVLFLGENFVEVIMSDEDGLIDEKMLYRFKCKYNLDNRFKFWHRYERNGYLTTTIIIR